MKLHVEAFNKYTVIEEISWHVIHKMLVLYEEEFYNVEEVNIYGHESKRALSNGMHLIKEKIISAKY